MALCTSMLALAGDCPARESPLKYKTFRGLMGGLGLVAAGGAAWLLVRACSGSETADTPPKPLPAAGSSAVPAAGSSAGSAAGSSTGPAKDLNARILIAAERRLSSDKMKDAIPGPAKVNLYQDAGFQQVNRLKVDLDRDDRWDEKWTFDRASGEVKRQIAPADDEQYTVELFLQPGGGWAAR